MKYAVVASGGKQYRLSEGEEVKVDKLSLKPEDAYTFEEVLLFVDGDTKKVGTPTVAGVLVKATVVAEKKERKIRVAKYKQKVRYRKVFGHRSIMTTLRIDSIQAGSSKKEKAA